MKNEIRVLLADDHEVVRSGLARMLERNDDMHIVGEATSGEQAYQMYTELDPDILIMDMSMPGIGGLEALRRILVRYTKAKVIMFSMHENVTLAVQSMSAGGVCLFFLGNISDTGNKINEAIIAMSTLPTKKVRINGINDFLI